MCQSGPYLTLLVVYDTLSWGCTMRRRFVSDTDLSGIVKLREGGASWLRIEQETDVPRRTAQKAYGNWRQSQSREELKSARQTVAAEALREHVDSLVHLAEVLADGLALPSFPNLALSADVFLDSLWDKDIRQRYEEGELGNRGMQRLKREYRLSLRCLQEHTREKVPWEALNNWTDAWNRSRDLGETLHQQAGTTIEADLGQHKGLMQLVMEDGRQDRALGQLTQRVVDTIWQDVVDGRLDTDSPTVQVTHASIDRVALRSASEADIEALALLGSKAANQLCADAREQAIQPLIDSVDAMRTAMEQLDASINQLVLRPLILRTTCEFCPA